MTDIGGPQPDKIGQRSADMGSPGGSTPGPNTPRCDNCGAGLDSGVLCGICGYEPPASSPAQVYFSALNGWNNRARGYRSGPVHGAHNGVSLPRLVGTVEIVPGFHVSVERWPNAIHRTLTRWLLGWKWSRHA